MKPSLQIQWESNPGYGPASETTLEDQINQLKWIVENNPEKLSAVWPFSAQSEESKKGLLDFQNMVHDQAFQNPIPKRMGEPAYIGPYMVGSTVPDPSYKEQGGDSYYSDMNDYSAKQGLLSDDVAEYMNENSLDSEDDDYLSLVASGDMTLEDAIRKLGRVPNRLNGLLGE